jgi:undecaprenyl pyrophosphate synthase
MADLAANLTADDITAHLYTVGRPDPDPVIRTSGEQRLSNLRTKESMICAPIPWCRTGIGVDT